MSPVAYHRDRAAVCRALAGGCMHHETRNALRELAFEHEAKAEKLEREQERLMWSESPSRQEAF